MGSLTTVLEKLKGSIMLTEEDRELLREARRNDPGTEPPCPFCQRPRVKRSDYIRCNPCGVNWLMEEMHLPNYLNRDPRISRAEAARTASTAKPTAVQQAEGAER